MNQTQELLQKAKKILGVKSDKDFCDRTGAKPAVVRRWRDGKGSIADSALTNVHPLCEALDMTLDEIYAYVTEGDCPKPKALASPQIVRAMTKVEQAIADLKVKMRIELGGNLAPESMKPSELLTVLFDRAASETERTIPEILGAELDPAEAAAAIAAYNAHSYDRPTVAIICLALNEQRDRLGLPDIDPETALLLWSRPGGGPLNAELTQAEERAI